MDEKYVLLKPYNAGEGVLAEGTEIVYFRGQFWVNGGPVPTSYNRMLGDLIKNEEYVKKMKIIKNTF
jgi:hypothetical protein